MSKKPTTNEFDYYLIDSKNDQTYPLIRIEERDNEENPTRIKIAFNDPIPKKPVMADYLSGPQPFMTSKIANIIKKLNHEGVRFVATELNYPKGTLCKDYLCMQVDNKIESMDLQKSVYTKPRRIYFIEKFVLDRAALAKIPLEKRLVYRLSERLSQVAFHKSVVDAIMAENPTGVQFRPIEELA